MTTMLAVSQDRLGGPDVLRVVELERPAPGPSEVLVRVHAAGLNPTDWVHRQVPGFLAKLPLVLGWDVSGVVEAVGIGVAMHRVGDEVFGMLPYPGGRRRRAFRGADRAVAGRVRHRHRQRAQARHSPRSRR
jgi:NADPH:quinone reductase-like Zn-dependent oxidoreductase